MSQQQQNNFTQSDPQPPKKPVSSRKKWACLAACAVFLAVAVLLLSPPKAVPEDAPPQAALSQVVYPEAISYEDIDGKQSVWQQNPVEDSFLASVRRFSDTLSPQVLAESSGNAAFSPLSLYYALALAGSGADGQTGAEFLTLLGVSGRNTLSVQCGNLYRTFYTDNEFGKLKIANSLWRNRLTSWKPEFSENAAKNFYASVFDVDFADPATASAMGDWVSEQTDGKLAPTPEVNPAQILSILNTVCFKGEWIDLFDVKGTASEDFFLPDGSAVQCDFMNRKAQNLFFRGEGYLQALLPLKNNAYMIFMLPDEGIAPRELLSASEKLPVLPGSGKWSNGEVTWKVPKFRFQTKLDLADTLKAAGIPSAFEANADFSGITQDMAFLSAVQQETLVSLDENGVEAAAYTEIMFLGASPPEGKADMILNRPFLFYILASDDTPLFAGICENPAAP